MKCALLSCVLSLAVVAGPALAVSQQPSPRESPVPVAETPSQFYLRYRTAVLKATTVDEVLAYWRAEVVSEFKQAPPEQRVDLAAVQRTYARVTDLNVVNEVVGQNGNGATVTLEGTIDQKRMTGTAYLVKENGEWKLFGLERWE